jgi:SAM-dependent methyltransferase
MPDNRFLDDVRTSYDTVAVDYARLLDDALAGNPFDRAVLGLFAERVRPRGGRVADLGCGAGRITAYLAGLGLDMFGIDLSAGMVAEASRRHPELGFRQGSILDLDLPDAEPDQAGPAGVVAWYSIIHTPTELLPQVFAGFQRVLAPGGELLLAFQTGGDQIHRLSAAYGHELTLDVHQRPVELVAELLTGAGFDVRARLTREPETHEWSAQAYVLARRP